MRIAVSGADGQLGTSLQKEIELRGHECLPLTLPEFDLENHPERTAFRDEPDVLIHGAAMTNVDGCTDDPALAYRLNAHATEALAKTASRAGCRMIYVSSNEVFPGDGDGLCYEFDAVGSVNIYGRSKLAGEKLAANVCNRLSIARLAWVFGPGFVNFPSKMCELADKLGSLAIVSDEVANPTYAPDAAKAIVSLAEADQSGIFHLCNEGAVSRYDFAKEIFALTGRGNIDVKPILLKDFVRPSRPPKYTPMGNEMAAALGIRLRPWQEALQDWVDAESSEKKV